MIEWIKKFVEPADVTPGTALDEDLMLELRTSLKELETLYRAGAMLCGHVCPEELSDGPEYFADLMMDLQRGLLVKVFVEIAASDRRWNEAEREAALIVLQHVWGEGVRSRDLKEVLQCATDLAESLTWNHLLDVFIRIPALSDQIAELDSLVIRIGNIIAKADGHIVPTEAEALTRIVDSLESVFSRRKRKSESNDGQSRSSTATAKSAAATSAKPAIPRKSSTGSSSRPAKSTANSNPKSSKRPKSANSPKSADLSVPEPNHQRQTTLAEALSELDELIGLESIKAEIRGLINFLKVQGERSHLGLPKTAVSLHTVFVGNPGTGKTTVARILGKALGGLGIVSGGHTVETDRSGLVAQFAGQTGPKVNERIDEALDGVLFIDEAYSLVADRGDDAFGHEAVQALMKRMEDDRERLVVIIAGYPEPMSKMLRSNPGLSSRFQRILDFPDYAVDELVSVFEGMCRKNHYTMSDDVTSKLKSILQDAVANHDEHFGNARLVRNLFEAAIRRLANRIINIAPLTHEILTALHADDLISPPESSLGPQSGD
jgi:SpoVK/Ycf46/Vps4 family AAA+-type ATPase